MPGNKKLLVLLTLVAMFSLAIAARAQTGKKDKSGSAVPTARLRIEVTGGDANKPVAEASVYVKWLEDPEHHKKNMLEMNLKTNEEGIVVAPEIPQGRTLVQVVLPGWKTYGMWFDVSQSEPTIEVHLTRPSSN